MPPAIEFRDVTKTFHSPRGAVQALDGVNLTVPTGEIFGVVGESGAGKSTFLHLTLALMRPTAGEVRVLGEPLTGPEAQLRHIRRRTGVVFQSYDLLSNLTVLENVMLPLRLERGSRRASLHMSRARELLAFVGLDRHRDERPAALSGGQQQRVAIARALATNPELVLFDEPTSALDVYSREQVLRLIERTRTELNATVVLVSHDLDAVKAVCDRAALLERGRLAEVLSVRKRPATPSRDYLDHARGLLEE